MQDRRTKQAFDELTIGHPIITIIAIVLLIGALGWMVGCSSPQPATTSDSATEETTAEEMTTEETNAEDQAALEGQSTGEVTEGAAEGEATVSNVESGVHEMVYMPTEAIQIDDLFGEQGLWGVMINGSPDVVVLHIGEGGLVDEAGQPMEISSIQPGDMITCSFDMITNSYPGQVTVESATFIGDGGEEAIQPYLDALTQLEGSAIGVIPGPESFEG